MAYAISVIGVAVTGGMLIFGGEMNEFARRMVMVVLVAAILMGATQIVGALKVSGAVTG